MIDLQKSDAKNFIIDEDGKSLIFPFRGLDGLGENVAQAIIEERNKAPFLSIEDLAIRAKVNSTTIEKMRALHIFDGMSESNQHMNFEPGNTESTYDVCRCMSFRKHVFDATTIFDVPFWNGTCSHVFCESIKISGLSHGTDVWAGNARDIIQSGEAEFKDIVGCRDDIMVNLIAYGMESKKAFKIMEFVRKGKPSADPETWRGFAEDMRACAVPEWYIASSLRAF